MVSDSPPPQPKANDEWKEENESGPPREAKWWYSTFHTVTAMVGAGVLSLPYAMAYLGWGPGTLVMVLSWCITLNTMRQTIELHECVPGIRFDRYYDLGRHAFGERLGPWIVLPQQLIVQVGCDIVYMVTGGKCLKKFMELACTNCTPIRQSYWICIFGAIHFFLSQLPNFNSVSTVSLAAAIMSLRGPGTLVMVLSWCITLNTMRQTIELHECVPGIRFDRYYDLGRHAFGERLGPWIVLPQQLIVQVGCDIVYMVTGGKCLKKFMELACTNCTPIRQSYWICIFGAIHFFLSQLPNFNSVSTVSLAAAIMSLSYSTIAWAGSLSRGRIPNVSYAYKKTSAADSMFRTFNALGQISFAYAGHAVVLEIQATIPSTPEKPSKVPMWKGALGSYFVNAICYFPVAFVGYWAFGNEVDDNVLVTLDKPSWLIAAANLMVVIHVIGSYQVYAMPVFHMLETIAVERLNLLPGLALRLVLRSAFVAFTLLVGVTFPFFGDLLGFFGGFGFAPTAYFLPSIIWLKIKKPKRFSISWCINWACIVIGVFIMVASTIGGVRNILADSSTYQFYS